MCITETKMRLIPLNSFSYTSNPHKASDYGDISSCFEKSNMHLYYIYDYCALALASTDTTSLNVLPTFKHTKFVSRMQFMGLLISKRHFGGIEPIL